MSTPLKETLLKELQTLAGELDDTGAGPRSGNGGDNGKLDPSATAERGKAPRLIQRAESIAVQRRNKQSDKNSRRESALAAQAAAPTQTALPI